MSQAKVDRYKEQKRNRSKLQKKEQMEWMLTKLALSLVALALVVWIGVSAYDLFTGSSTATTELETYTVNTSSLDSYLSELTADAE